jgi:hypothetical protein
LPELSVTLDDFTKLIRNTYLIPPLTNPARGVRLTPLGLEKGLAMSSFKTDQDRRVLPESAVLVPDSVARSLAGHIDAKVETIRDSNDSSASPRKQTSDLNLYAMPGEDDYFLSHPNTVLLGFLGTVASILLVIMLIVWLASTVLKP